MSKFEIPYVDLGRQYSDLREELLEAQDRVYRSGRVLDGDQVSKFQQAMALRCQRKYAVAVNSGTQALIFALLSTAHHGRGVLLPSLSFIASANAVHMARQEIMFADVDTRGLIDLNNISWHPGSNNIRTLMYVNLYGHMVDPDAIDVYNQFWAGDQPLTVIEDAAQSFGASWNGRPSGSFGDVSCLSFDPMKNLPNYGSGGMLLTDDYHLFRSFMDLRDNGKHNQHSSPGTNSKISESDCAAMLVKLSYFDQWQERRQEIADYYTANLENHVQVPDVDPRCQHSWHKYVIRTEFADRDDLRDSLAQQGVECRVHYYQPMSSEDLYYDHDMSRWEQAMDICNTAISLPIYPELTDTEVERVVESVLAHYERKR